jgi:hypothetical protein
VRVAAVDRERAPGAAAEEDEVDREIVDAAQSEADRDEQQQLAASHEQDRQCPDRPVFQLGPPRRLKLQFRR